jgi:ABC-2 type transport system ATP-binding protein
MPDRDGEIVVSVDHVYKDFILPHERTDSIKGLVTNAFKKKDKEKDTQHALRDIHFDIKKGEFFGIVGRNGSGKSTLLKILAGIYQPTKGSISVKGKLVPFIELGVGFNAELTGRENIYLNGAMLGFTRKEIDAMYHDIVSFAELENFMDQKLKNYSSGMQVRLAFSMATRSEADILLVDEVLAVGDADFQRKCFDYFRTLKKNHKTVVFVTHDMNAVREYCERAILIEDSKTVLEGKASAVANAYTRMFSESRKGTDNKNAKDMFRWGDGAVTYTNLKLSSKKVTDEDDSLTITLTAQAKEDVTNPVFGFLVKTASGTQVLGTNSQLKAKRVKELKAGQKIDIVWKVPNIFADGEHFIDPAIVHHDGSVVCDWWEDAASFTSFRAKPTPYLTYPAIELGLSDIKSNA